MNCTLNSLLVRLDIAIKIVVLSQSSMQITVHFKSISLGKGGLHR